MTNTNQDRHLRVRSILARTVLILPLSLALSGLRPQPAQAQTVTSALPCAAALSSLISEWRSIGFAEPGKPAQVIVAGQHGGTTTGGQFYVIIQQIRVGARACEAGRDAIALRHINPVRAMLARTHPI
jgi:hypothetical protein